MSGLEVQVTDLEISMLKVLVKAFRGKARFRQATLSCDSSYCFFFVCLFCFRLFDTVSLSLRDNSILCLSQPVFCYFCVLLFCFTILTLQKHAYIENFTSKNWTFSDKILWYFSYSTQNTIYVFSRNKKNYVYPCKPQFYYIKVGFKGVEII